jgi:hypothetical protein
VVHVAFTLSGAKSAILSRMGSRVPLALGALAALVGLGVAAAADPVLPELGHSASAAAKAARVGPVDARAAAGRAGDRKVPSAAGLRAAEEYAQGRAGIVALAVVNSDGDLRGEHERRRFAAASVVKAMLLAAETRRLKHAGEGVDGATDSLLTAMITASDNGAADAIYGRVGDAGLNAVAARAGMTRFTVAGHWGNAQIAAADMARFFGDLDRQFPRRFRAYAKGLLGSVIESQSWGIPAAAGDRWAVRFKGGWLPTHALVHQAAELRERDGSRVLAIVVLTDDQPSFAYGVESVEGVAARLLSRDGKP